MTDRPTNPDVEDDGRLATAYDVKSVMASLTARDKQALRNSNRLRRERNINWFSLAIILALIASLVAYQYITVRNLQEDLYQGCLQRNATVIQQQRLYRTMATVSPEPQKSLIQNGADRLQLVDCGRTKSPNSP
jgi:hypothetical protein